MSSHLLFVRLAKCVIKRNYAVFVFVREHQRGADPPGEVPPALLQAGVGDDGQLQLLPLLVPPAAGRLPQPGRGRREGGPREGLQTLPQSLRHGQPGSVIVVAADVIGQYMSWSTTFVSVFKF